MSARSEGGGGPASSEVRGSGTRGEAPEPMGNQHLPSPLDFREVGSQNWEEQQAYATRPLSPKKRKTDTHSAFGTQDNALLQAIGDLVARASRVPNEAIAAAACSDDVRSFQAEVEEIKKERIRLTQLTDEVMTMLYTLKQEVGGISSRPKSSALPRGTAQTSSKPVNDTINSRQYGPL